MRPKANISNFGTNLWEYLATKVWYNVPFDIKSIENLELFKKKIRKWKALPVKMLILYCIPLLSSNIPVKCNFHMLIWHFNHNFVYLRKILGVARALVILSKRYSLKPFSKLF